MKDSGTVRFRLMKDPKTLTKKQWFDCIRPNTYSNNHWFNNKQSEEDEPKN